MIPTFKDDRLIPNHYKPGVPKKSKTQRFLHPPHMSNTSFTCVFALVTHEVGVLRVSFLTVLIVAVVKP